MTYSEFVPLFKALSDETRLKIIDMLSCGEMCACDILKQVNITQPTLSYHMKALTDSGLVKVTFDRPWMHYTINAEKARQFLSFLKEITENKTTCICNDKSKCD